MITTLEPEVVDTGRYSVKETARSLSINPKTLYNHVNQGLISYGIRKSNGCKYFMEYEIKRYWRAHY